MRKMQKKYLDKINKYKGVTDEAIAFLSREDLTIAQLKIAYDYITANINKHDMAAIIKELELYIDAPGTNIFLPSCSEDLLMGNSEGKTLIYDAYNKLQVLGCEDMFFSVDICEILIHFISNNMSNCLSLVLSGSSESFQIILSGSTITYRIPCLSISSITDSV